MYTFYFRYCILHIYFWYIHNIILYKTMYVHILQYAYQPLKNKYCRNTRPQPDPITNEHHPKGKCLIQCSLDIAWRFPTGWVNLPRPGPPT